MYDISSLRINTLPTPEAQSVWQCTDYHQSVFGRHIFIKKSCTNFHENPTDYLATNTGPQTDERKLSAQKGVFVLFRKDHANNGVDTAHVQIFLSRVM